jgi:hypothetical protein
MIGRGSCWLIAVIGPQPPVLHRQDIGVRELNGRTLAAMLVTLKFSNFRLEPYRCPAVRV